MNTRKLSTDFIAEMLYHYDGLCRQPKAQCDACQASDIFMSWLSRKSPELHEILSQSDMSVTEWREMIDTQPALIPFYQARDEIIDVQNDCEDHFNDADMMQRMSERLNNILKLLERFRNGMDLPNLRYDEWAEIDWSEPDG